MIRRGFLGQSALSNKLTVQAKAYLNEGHLKLKQTRSHGVRFEFLTEMSVGTMFSCDVTHHSLVNRCQNVESADCNFQGPGPLQPKFQITSGGETSTVQPCG